MRKTYLNPAHNRTRQRAQGARKANRKSYQQDAAFSHSNEGANNQQTVAQSSSPRKRNIDVNQVVCKLARNMFDRLPRELQKLETKQSCIAAVGDRHNDKVGDLGDFYGWLMKRAEEISHAWDFTKVCEDAGLKSKEEQLAVSEHLVLEPKAVINKIRMEGLATYDGNIKMFRERLVPEAYRYEKKANDAAAPATEEPTDE